jgi:hypothetical protein
MRGHHCPIPIVLGPAVSSFSLAPWLAEHERRVIQASSSIPCQRALSAAMSASDKLVAVPLEPSYRSDSNWLVVELEAAASASSIAELPVVAVDVLDAAGLVDAGAAGASVVEFVGSAADAL